MINHKHIETIVNINKTFRSYLAIKKNKPFKKYNRIYHHHLMKTGGTSLNTMFLNLSTKNVNNLYNQLMQSSDLRIIKNNWVFSAWNQLIISSGLYHYAWSHRPIYETLITSNTFIITTIRHPYDRVFSRYKHLLNDYNDGINLRENKEFSYLGKNFEDYLKNIPQSELCHQLHMFSKSLNVEEGINRLSKINYIITIDTFQEDINILNKILNINLIPIHIRENNIMKVDNLGMLFKVVEEKIRPEIEFYEQAIKLKDKKYFLNE